MRNGIPDVSREGIPGGIGDHVIDDQRNIQVVSENIFSTTMGCIKKKYDVEHVPPKYLTLIMICVHKSSLDPE